MQINFSKPNIEKLNKQSYQCVDMHFHSCYSDGLADIDEILEKSRREGFGVAIADHNEIQGCLEAFRKKRKDDFVIPAIEVKSDELVDILFYFYDVEEYIKFYEKEIKKNKKRLFHTSKTSLSLEEIYEISTKYNCVSCVAHPFGYSMRASRKNIFKIHKSILEKFKVVEAINGGNLRRHNELAVNYIIENKKAVTGGSDAHVLKNIGRVITFSKADTVKEFLDNIKNKKAGVVGVERKKGKLSQYTDYAVAMVAKKLKKK